MMPISTRPARTPHRYRTSRAAHTRPPSPAAGPGIPYQAPAIVLPTMATAARHPARIPFAVMRNGGGPTNSAGPHTMLRRRTIRCCSSAVAECRPRRMRHPFPPRFGLRHPGARGNAPHRPAPDRLARSTLPRSGSMAGCPHVPLAWCKRGGRRRRAAGDVRRHRPPERPAPTPAGAAPSRPGLERAALPLPR